MTLATVDPNQGDPSRVFDYGIPTIIGNNAMPLNSMIVLALVVSVFTLLSATLLWADFQTRRPNE
jgi:hypothetical protein